MHKCNKITFILLSGLFLKLDAQIIRPIDSATLPSNLAPVKEIFYTEDEKVYLIHTNSTITKYRKNALQPWQTSAYFVEIEQFQPINSFFIAFYQPGIQQIKFLDEQLFITQNPLSWRNSINDRIDAVHVKDNWNVWLLSGNTGFLYEYNFRWKKILSKRQLQFTSDEIPKRLWVEGKSVYVKFNDHLDIFNLSGRLITTLELKPNATFAAGGNKILVFEPHQCREWLLDGKNLQLTSEKKLAKGKLLFFNGKKFIGLEQNVLYFYEP